MFKTIINRGLIICVVAFCFVAGRGNLILVAQVQQAEQGQSSQIVYQIFDEQSGNNHILFSIPKALNQRTQASEETDPVLASRNWINGQLDVIGLTEVKALDLASIKYSPAGVHITYQQVHLGIPVYNSNIKVNLDNQNRPTFVISNINTLDLPSIEINNAIPPAKYKIEDVLTSLNGKSRHATPIQVFYPYDNQLSLAWKVIYWPAGGGEWEAVIDAETNQILKHYQLSIPLKPVNLNQRDEQVAKNSVPPIITDQPTGETRAAGQGYVFIPDPLSVTGSDYAGAYIDRDDADTLALNNQRQLVTLPVVTQNMDGLWELKSDYVEIVGDNNYTPPAIASPDSFRYTRSDDHFEAVNVFYHINSAQKWLQENGFLQIRTDGVNANPHGEGADDNSFYLFSQNLISFGDGGVDDGEDADIVVHEYGHAVLESISEGIYTNFDGKALHEGWSDYFAGSFKKALYDDGQLPGSEDVWQTLFTWDTGRGTIWPGRNLNSTSHYPEVAGFNQFLYRTGSLWATTLMKIQEELGRRTTDVLVIQSMYYYTPGLSMRDAAEALLQADEALYGGTYKKNIQYHLEIAGFLDTTDLSAGGTPPNITLEPVLHPIFPNPVVSQATGRFTINQSATNIIIDIVDLLGRPVRTIVEETAPTGTWTYNLNTTGLPSGAYLLRMRADNIQKVQSLIIIN